MSEPFRWIKIGVIIGFTLGGLYAAWLTGRHRP